MTFEPTPSQTVGPFFHIGTSQLERADFAAPGMRGERVTIQGRVLDGDGAGVCDAMLEIWQADDSGNFPHWNDLRAAPLQFNGFGRVSSVADGSFQFTTIKPGPIREPRGTRQAPHLVVTIFSRGLLKPLISRIYFLDEPSNREDEVLGLIPVERRGTLIARRLSAATNRFEWNVILQGDQETVFFEC